MRREIVIPFDGDSSRDSRDNLIKALEEQLEKYKKGDGEKRDAPTRRRRAARPTRKSEMYNNM